MKKLKSSQPFWQAKILALLSNSSFRLSSNSAEHLWQELKCLKDTADSGDFSNAWSAVDQAVPSEILNCLDARKVFWWLWRCYPQALATTSLTWVDPSDLTWSQASVAAALAGSRAGYGVHARSSELGQFLQETSGRSSCPHLVLFSFTAVEEFVRLSCTLEDIHVGAWLVHYLAAKVCWKLAWKYGANSILSPCLHSQPLIDDWLLQHYPEFQPWITIVPEITRRASFSSEIILVLPDNGTDPHKAKGNPVWATMVYAEQALRQEWLAVSHIVLEVLQQKNPDWKTIDLQQWEAGLESQWQSCWVALPIDDPSLSLVNMLEQARQSLAAAKQVQNWKIPTVFGSCSTLSGVNSAICSADLEPLWLKKQTQDVWQTQVSSSKNVAALNAVEVVKHELPHVLPLLNLKINESFCSAALIPCSSQWQVLAIGSRDPDTALNVFSNEVEQFYCSLSDLVEQHYQGRLLYATHNQMLLSTNLRDWDCLLWDIHQRFRADTPLTLWQQGGINFGLVIVQQSLPLPIALEALHSAKNAAQQRSTGKGIQVRILYSNGTTLTATANFDLFNQWRSLLNCFSQAQPTLFQQAASLWQRHPAPRLDAIELWVKTLCQHRPEYFINRDDTKRLFHHALTEFLSALWHIMQPEEFDREVQNWLKLADSVEQSRCMAIDLSSRTTHINKETLIARKSLLRPLMRKRVREGAK